MGAAVPVDERISIINICREMHWTYQEYLAQPYWFIQLVLPIANKEAEVEKLKADNAQRQAKK